MDKKIYFNGLYDYYMGLFTEKQRAYFEAYYFSDFSLAEISENYHVSRNAVYRQIQIVENKLEEYENILGLYQKGKCIRLLLENVEDKKLKEKIEELI